jgi:hypothetical protein
MGSYIGSKFVAGGKETLTPREIKYITGFVTFSVGVGFLYSAYFEKN